MEERAIRSHRIADGNQRRTFVKGGLATITSAIGASALGCAPAQKSERR
ncbi:MAG: hypothetical protein ACLUE1_03535 [Adlercreutzia equolifaciens]